jgi:tetratricopeptide (TPR) repeat protein
VREAGSLLLKLERVREVLPLCEKAILIDPFEEVVHKLMIFALVRQGRHQEALRHYRYVNDLFYRELGVRPSESMRRLYDKITQAIHNTETDLDIIKESLKEPEANGAFTCDYEVFKNVYRLEARAASRLGRSVFLGLLTLLDDNDLAPATDVLTPEMDRLLAVINTSLRKGDVISRFSASQYILMLPNLTFENGQMVLDRIGRRFDVKNRTHGVHLSCTLHPMDPVI